MRGYRLRVFQEIWAIARLTAILILEFWRGSRPPTAALNHARPREFRNLRVRNSQFWLPQDQEVTAEPWEQSKRTLSNGETEVHYRREIIYGTRRSVRYWELTTDPETLPDNSTVFVMSNAPAIKLDEIGDAYGDRTWVEYGLKQSKDALHPWWDNQHGWKNLLNNLRLVVTTQAINSPHPLAPSPKSGEGEPSQFKVPLPTWERDLG